MRCLIYTLFQATGGSQWVVELGIRETEGVVSQDRNLTRQSFDGRREAEQWLREQAKILSVPLVPKTISETTVPLPFGGPIPDKS